MSKASERAYTLIRARILSGALPPGAPLKEEELAESCGVSRTPVRDALRRLEAEMHVERIGGSRSFVADWSMDDIDDMFTLRGMLEGHAAARAARRIDPAGLAALAAHNQAIAAAITGEPDLDAFLFHNRAFHALILEAAGSERLTSMLSRLIQQPVIQRTARHYDYAQLMRSHAEHDELLAALGKRDSEWARAVMTGHIRRAFHAYAETYEEQSAARPG